MKRLHALAILLCASLMATTSAQGGAKKPMFKTPEEVFKAAQEATAKNDWKTFISYLAPETVDHLTAMVIVMGAVAKDIAPPPKGLPADKIKSIKEPLDKIFTKYGLTDDVLKKMKADNLFPTFDKGPQPDLLPKLAAAVKKDRASFATEGVMVIIPVMAGGPDEMDPFKDRVLKDLKVDGDKASAQLVRTINGMEQLQPILFRQIDGSWYINMPMGGAKEVKPPVKQVDKQ